MPKYFLFNRVNRCDDSAVMSHLEIIKLLVCLENTGTLRWMTQYGKLSQENNVAEHKNIP